MTNQPVFLVSLPDASWPELRIALPVPDPDITAARGLTDDETLNIEMNIGIFPYKNPTASREDVLEAITVLDALGKRLVRILGIKHPKTFNVQAAAYQARQKLAAMEPPRRATLEDALAAFDL